MKKKMFWIVGFIVSSFMAIIYFAGNNFLLPINLGEQPFPLKQKWTISLDKGSMFDSVVDLSETKDGFLLARTKEGIYTLQENSGQVMWFFRLDNQVQSHPVIVSNRIVYVSDSRNLFAISQDDGKSLWKQSVQDNNWVVNASENMVLVNEVANDIVSFNTDTGRLLWRKHVGTGFVHAYIDGDLIYIPDDGVEAIDAQAGSLIWKHGEAVIGNSTFIDGVIYYEAGDKLKAFDAGERRELWSVELSGFGIKYPAVHGDFVFVTDMDYLYVINRITGVLVHKIASNAPQNPSFLGNEVYVMGQFSRAVDGFDIDTREQIGSLGTAIPVLLGVENQKMISTGNLLVFASGNRLFAYAK